MALADLHEPDPVAALLARLDDDRRLAHRRVLAGRPARTATLARPLPDEVWEALGVEHLWSHQVEALDALRDGRSVVVATGTASGKSLCYQAAIAEAMAASDPAATALAIYPTKALAQDQLRALTAADLPGVVAAAYDGDCTPEERTWVRANANVVLTNPEMLHQGVLSRHDRWATFLHRLRFVVVDELHVLRGVFGSHVAHVLRRLRRLADHYGADPTFAFTSATIGSPGRLASDLCGLEVVEVLDDGAPRGPRTVVLWDPGAGDRDGPAVTLVADAGAAHGDGPGSTGPDDRQAAGGEPSTPPDGDTGPAGPDGPGRRRSAHREAAELTAQLVQADARTITFCRSRQGTEVVAADVARHLPSRLRDAVRPYRAGFLVDERRAIEAELFAGRLRAVVATSALELGIDVGGLDACVLDGFPGTIASMWQQLGRAGRGTAPSVGVLVAGDDQLDQWLVRHPDEVFRRPPEPAVINPANPHVLLPQLACAAYELPLHPDDERWWPGLLDEGVRRLVLDDDLRVRPRHRLRPPGPVAVWAGRRPPARGVGLRRGGGTEVGIHLGDGTLVGTVDAGRAPSQVHPGALYLHQGRRYQVERLDLDEGVAVVGPAVDGEHTRPRTDTQVTILDVDEDEPLGPGRRALGAVRVRRQVTGYRRIDTRTGATLEVVPLDLPPQVLDTRALWLTVPEDVLDETGVDPARVPGALHALEHATIGVLPLFTICDRWDVGGVSTAHQAETGLPTVVVHDAHPGGTGIAELGWEVLDELLGTTLELVTACPCADGCPSCVQSPKCGNGNDPLDKAGAVAVLRALLDADGPVTPRPA